MTHRYQCRVRWSDVDGYGHVNNVKFLEYFQEARIAFLNETLTGRPFDMVVARITTHYKRAMFFRHEPYVVETSVTRIGRTSYTVHNEIVDPLDADAVVSTADIVLVTVDPETGRSCEHQPEVLALLERHLVEDTRV